MFDIILRYLYGFAKIHLRGIHINRFVNLCKARDIKLWNLEQKEDEIFFFTANGGIPAFFAIVWLSIPRPAISRTFKRI